MTGHLPPLTTTNLTTTNLTETEPPMAQDPHRSLGDQLWGIYSVWRRHATVYQKTWLVNFLPPITEPLVYLLAFGYGLTPMMGELFYLGQPLTYPQFIGPGMIAVALLFQAFFEASYGSFIRLHYQHTWQALLTGPLSYTQVFVGDMLWAMTRGMISGVVTGLVTVILGFYSWQGLLGSLPVMLLACGMFAAMGLWTAGLVKTVDQINVPIFMLAVPMFVLCGTYFPRENLPGVVGFVATVLPLASVVDLLRWPLGLPPYWPLQLLWILVLLGILSKLAHRQIARRLFA
ncbi:MAG: ABC transporter permease [Cyanophyceae cyanobacterium]